MKIKRFVPLILTACVFLTVFGFGLSRRTQPQAVQQTIINGESTADSTVIQTAESSDSEMKGVWVTYMDLSMENESDKSEKAFKQKFSDIAKNAKNFGFNTLIVHVRPFGDALYNSKYYPYSHILTGTQGGEPNYDALKDMCEICREYGLKIHAWINPYRVKVSETPNKLAENNPYVQDKSLGFETENGIMLDPSNEKTRELITNGVKEIVENYDVDGIQFDDYFYPESISDEDSRQYNTYKASVGDANSMNVGNWRIANVNMLIAQVYRTIHRINPNVMFGISPQGNLKNNEKLYADVKSWCSCSGFADYICPQIYFSPDNPALGFEDALNEWQNLRLASGTKLYIGLAGYKAGGNADSGTWQDRNDILKEEYQMIRKSSKADGFMLYSYQSLLSDDAESEMSNLKDELN